jgi:hypothetical protein
LPFGGHALETIERLAEGRHDLDAGAVHSHRKRLPAAPPQQQRMRIRVGNHVETVLRPIVDDGVERQCLGDAPARAVDEHRGHGEAVGLEPAVRLPLRGVTRR